MPEEMRMDRKCEWLRICVNDWEDVNDRGNVNNMDTVHARKKR